MKLKHKLSFVVWSLIAAIAMTRDELRFESVRQWRYAVF
jgi:hypothetical protein